MARRVRMSPVDTAWLRMDSPANLMMIVGVDVFDGAVDLANLRALIESHLLQYREFRSRVVRDPAGAWWEEDENFDLDHHLVRVALPGKASTDELQKMVAQLAGQSLDPARPLWQMHLVENYRGERGDRDSGERDSSERDHALIIRIHHCIADGIALIGVLLSLTTTAADAEPAPPRRSRPAKGEHDAPWEALLKPFTDATVRAIDVTGGVAAQMLKAYGAVLDDPNLAGAAASRYAHVATQVGKDLAAMALMDADTTTSLKGKPGGSKVVAWNEPLPLADVKAVGKALGCSVNDVLLACAAGAFRAYLVGRGEDVRRAEMRAMVPVNLRGSVGAPKKLGNKFGLVPLLLPIGIEDPIERVYEVQRRMNDLKGGYTAVLAMALLGVAGLAPRAVQKQVLDMLARKATAVMTNVPGPQHPLYMAGTHLKRMMFWVPQSGDIGLGVSILSYDGGVQFGLIADKKLCAQPQAVIDRFAPEFETLVHALLLAPWEAGVDPGLAERSLGATEPLAAAAAHLKRASAGEVGAREARPAGEPAARASAGSAGDGKARHAAGKPNGADASATPARPRKRRSAFAAARSVS